MDINNIEKYMDFSSTLASEHEEDGSVSEDNAHWIAATWTRNFMVSDPLLDWLDLYGEEKGFKKDKEYEGYDERMDFSLFIRDKGVSFENAVIKHFSSLMPVYTVGGKIPGETTSDRPKVLSQTIDAMKSGKPLIYQPNLSNATNFTWGYPDLIIRSDKLREIFPESISEEESKIGAPGIGLWSCHYRVIDIKFTTLPFNKGGDLSTSDDSIWSYMAQVYIYNMALGNMQGYTPHGGYLLGRKWRQGEQRGNNCMDRLGFVPMNVNSVKRGPLDKMVQNACLWLRNLVIDGSSWDVTPIPSLPELRPDMSSSSDTPWHRAKAEINNVVKDLTSLWYVGVAKRDIANQQGIFKWDEPSYTSRDVGVKGQKTEPVLQKIIDINRDANGQAIMPNKIVNTDNSWRNGNHLEFYVDFETVSDLDDDFSTIPVSGGQPLIFMIGCGHLEGEEWKWECFTTDSLTEDSEASIIDQWFEHMETVKESFDVKDYDPLVFHWSHAEQSTFENAFNSAKNRQPDYQWNSPNWYDLCSKVVKAEPFVVLGSFGFGLKTVATAMRKLGVIDIEWDSGPTDGLGAMVGAWQGAQQALHDGVSMQSNALIQEISKYNEVDCKVMAEILLYLRKNH